MTTLSYIAFTAPLSTISSAVSQRTPIVSKKKSIFQLQIATTSRVLQKCKGWRCSPVYMAHELNDDNDSNVQQPLTTHSETTERSETTDGAETYSGPFGWFKRMMANRSELKASTLRNYGIAALISYGLFDFVTYSISFLLSLRAYIAAGKQLTWKTLPQVCNQLLILTRCLTSSCET